MTEPVQIFAFSLDLENEDLDTFKARISETLRLTLGEPPADLAANEILVDDENFPPNIRAASGYVQAVIDRDDFSGFFAVDMVDSFLAGVEWADQHPDTDDEWVPTPEDSAFALIETYATLPDDTVTTIALTISPVDSEKIIGWAKEGGITLSPGKIVRTV